MKLTIKYKYLFILLFIISSNSIIISQYTKIFLGNKDFVELGDGVDEAVKSELILKAEEMFNLYNKCGRFAEVGSSRIDEELVNCFTELFITNGTHFNDLQNKKEKIPITKYANMVWDNMGSNDDGSAGLDYELSGELVSIKINPSGNYIVKMNLFKKHHIQLDKTLLRLPYDFKGTEYFLTGTIEASKYDPTDAKFVSIEGEVGSVLEDKLGVLAICGNYGVMGGLATQSGNGFTDVTPQTSNYGIDVSYLRSIGSNQKWFLSTGLRVNFLNVMTNFTDKFVAQDIGGKTVDVPIQSFESGQIKSSTTKGFLSVDSVEEGEENIENASLISLGLGIAHNIKVNDNRLFLKVNFVASRLSNVKAGSRKVTGSGYGIPSVDGFASIAELRANGILEEYRQQSQIIEENASVTADPNFSFGIQISPVYQMRLNYKYGLEFGFDYHYGLTDMFKHQDKTDYLSSEGNSSIVQDYFSTSPFNNLNLKAGFYIQFN